MNSKEYQSNYYKASKEKIKEYKKKYYKDNKEKFDEYQKKRKERRENNKTKNCFECVHEQCINCKEGV